MVTGTRAEYGTLRSLLRALVADTRVDLQLIVTGMHLLPRFGHTIDEIKADGFAPSAVIPMQRGGDDPLDQAAGLGRGVSAIAKYLQKARTDIVVVLGDRIEAMAGALAAVTTGRILAHIHGGDVAQGDFDESLRHAITKLAHMHFAATPASGHRIIRLGEDRRRVSVCGAPGLDALRSVMAGMRPRPVTGRDSHALIIHHAHGRLAAVERRIATAVFSAVRAAGLRRTIIYPNSDRGHAGVLRAISEHVRRYPAEVVVHRSLPRDEFLRELVNARVLVGNSSCGLIEAPFAGTPSVNVGDRQHGREPGGPSVIHTSESVSSLRTAIRRAMELHTRPGAATVYGDGRAGARIARVLIEMPLDPALLRKIITF